MCAPAYVLAHASNHKQRLLAYHVRSAFCHRTVAVLHGTTMQSACDTQTLQTELRPGRKCFSA